MKKILLITLCAILMISVLGVTAFADDGEAVQAGATVFDELYSIVITHSDKIFSALAFIGSILLAFAYKKGILPLIKGALSKLSDAVSALRDESEKASESAKTALDEAKGKLELTEENLTSLTEKLEALELELAEARNGQQSLADMKTILNAQIDMLYEIFMSSSIPLYQKEAVGERIGAMRKLVATEDNEGA